MRQPVLPNAPIQALVLAAGQGHRFGGDKLHALYRGRPLLSHALAVVRAACNQGLLCDGHVVIAAGDQRAVGLVRAAGLVPVINDSPTLGLSRSLRLGLASLENRAVGEGGAALIFLGDQPLVRLEVIEQLVRVWSHECVTTVRPRYECRGDVPGHPVLLSREMWPRACRLEGDLGFGAVLDASSPGTVTVDIAGDNPDVDTRADLQALERADP
jgi:molybdenum cofactor cytidylyltransferase